jgi:hypothetical protein
LCAAGDERPNSAHRLRFPHEAAGGQRARSQPDASASGRTGLHDIAALVANQGGELHVADLIAAAEGRTAPSNIATAHIGGAGNGGSEDALLDDVARAAYRQRLVELRDDLDEAQRFNDVVRAEKARSEMHILSGELAAALGLGGRPRATSTSAERARKALAQRVRNALRRVERANPDLARHLERSLRLGSFCSYAPERRTDWVL